MANGAAFPWSVESVNARRGLLDVVRVRGDCRKGAERRRVKRFLTDVGGTGAESGDSGYDRVLSLLLLLLLCDLGLKTRASPRGESGEPGESDLRK